MELIKKYKKPIASGIILLLILVVTIVNYVFNMENSNNVYAEVQDCICEDDTNPSLEEFYVDIKGAVKNPGVYLANANNIVKDIIDMAGGLKSNATTDNLNLSQKVTSEMVIYVYTKTELKNSTTSTTSPSTNNSTTSPSTSNSTSSSNICDPNPSYGSSTEVSSLVNINTASKEELMSIPNIGASKADAIIVYRSDHVFTKIEDIINVSGIGDALFAKIKDYITV